MCAAQLALFATNALLSLAHSAASASSANIPAPVITAKAPAVSEWVAENHLKEFSHGSTTFAAASSASSTATALSEPAGNDSYITHSVGVGNAGPDEFVLRNGHLVHATAQPVLTAEECEALMCTARGLEPEIPLPPCNAVYIYAPECVHPNSERCAARNFFGTPAAEPRRPPP